MHSGHGPTDSKEQLEKQYKALTSVLNEDETFNRVLLSVFEKMDLDASGTIEVSELEQFILHLSKRMGSNTPSSTQILSIFKHLDLDSDKHIQKEELSVFVRHVFQEQVKFILMKLKTLKNLPEEPRK
mmetsp:Transcript_10649/g.19445  ORF Transcript_10649/g.19445 Transcript_10649/m.19445 type:complete len:128 (-) Transcript_10649:388-771(-)